MTKFNPSKYWEDRLAKNINLRGTGHRAFNLRYNEYLYKTQEDAMDILLDESKVDPKNKKILDIGSGNGFYIKYFLDKGAANVWGLDITEASVNYLRTKYP